MKNWTDIGEEIRDEVMRAISVGDYSSLNQSIRRSLAESLGFWTDRPQTGPRPTQTGPRPEGMKGTYTSPKSAQGTYTYGGRPQGTYASQQSAQGYYANGKIQSAPYRRQGGAIDYGTAIVPQNKNYDLVPVQKYRRSGTLMQVLGGVMTGGLSLAFSATTIIALTAGGPLAWAAEVILGGLLGGSITTLVAGGKRKDREDRFKRYLAAIGNRTYCAVKDMGAAVGKSAEYVKKDLEEMIRRGWFREGHLDDAGVTMITDNQTYEQYRIAMDQAKKREEEAAKEKALTKAERERNAVIEEGLGYLRKIRAANDAIPGEEISEKITHIEHVVGRIYARVKDHPEQASDLRKMQEYYLPTTVKLLEAYAEMDAQPVSGDNIRSAKKEIEDTLDTLNAAFEKLFDDLFRDAAWDVSTDISVLETLLAQDGLTEGEIRRAGK